MRVTAVLLFFALVTTAGFCRSVTMRWLWLGEGLKVKDHATWLRIGIWFVTTFNLWMWILSRL